MKELGNLAIICARRPSLLLQVHEGMVSVHLGTGPDRQTLSAACDDEGEIRRIIQELNFGAFRIQ